MNQREMKKLINHFDTYFNQNDCMILHPIVMKPHIDTLLYKPNEAFPYWKLVTMGASDYRMPAKNAQLGDRNEYIMFIDPGEDLNDKDVLNRYVVYLMEVAHYPISNKCYISYGHSVEWAPNNEDEMVCAFVELPQIITDSRVLFCELGRTKTATCLQVVLLTRQETDKLLKIGPQQFSQYLYPDDGGPRHFICELRRSDKF